MAASAFKTSLNRLLERVTKIKFRVVKWNLNAMLQKSRNVKNSNPGIRDDGLPSNVQME